MRLLGYLPPVELGRLRLALARDDSIHPVSDSESFFRSAAQGGWDLILADPEMEEERNAHDFIEQLCQSRIPLIIYTAMSRVTASAIASLSSQCLAGVILRDYDDASELLRNALAKIPVEFFGARMLERLGKTLDELPTPIARATAAAFCSARLMQSVSEYAALSHRSRRSVDRSLHSVGLSASKWMVRGAQFLRAYPLVQSPLIPFAAISRANGYGSTRVLRQNALALTGMEPAYLRAHARGIDIIAVVEAALRI